jgi:hypothetical protein
MSDQLTQSPPRTCFVVMGFGKKTDFATGRSLNLDKSYKNMIKPAVEAAGLKCVRADEIVHSGLIDTPMYDQLLKADVVVADLSTANCNAFYELGVRHALRPFTTVVISEDGFTSPFDVNHIVIRRYHHLGEDIGFDEVMRFREELTSAIRTIMAKDPRDPDSPVYSFIKNLKPPEVEAVAHAMAAAAPGATESAGGTGASAEAPGMTAAHSFMMQQAEDAQKEAGRLANEGRLTDARDQRSKPSAPCEKPPALRQRRQRSGRRIRMSSSALPSSPTKAKTRTKRRL